MIPRGILFKMMKNKFSKRAGFTVTKMKIKINYEKDFFIINLSNKENEIEDSSKVSNFSDMSDMLLLKIKKRVEADKINVLEMDVNFETKESNAVVYYEQNGEFLKIDLNEVF